MALPVTSTPPIPSDVTLFALTSPFITTAFVVSYMVSPCLNTFGKTTSAGQQNALTSPSGVGVISPLQIRLPRIITLIFFIVCKIFYYLCVAAVGDAPVRATELIYFPAYRRRQSVTLLPSALCRDCFLCMAIEYQARFMGLGELGAAVFEFACQVGVPAFRSTKAGDIAFQLKSISRVLNVEVDFQPPHTSFLSAVYFWLKAVQQAQLSVS